MQPQQLSSIEDLFRLTAGLRSPWRPLKCRVNDVSKTVHLWVTRQDTGSVEQRRWWFGAKTSAPPIKSPAGEDKQWRHVDCLSYTCYIHTMDPLQPSDHELDWFGPPNISFTSVLARKIFLMLTEGVEMQVICDILRIPFAELWKFKYEIDNGLLHFEYTPPTPRAVKSTPVPAQALAAVSDASTTSTPIPDLSNPVWEHLLTGSMIIDVKTLSLQLLLTKLRQQVSHMQSADVKIMKMRELHRYVERHQRVLGHELKQLQQHSTGN